MTIMATAPVPGALTLPEIPTIDFSQVTNPEPCPQGVPWCTDHVEGSEADMNPGTHWHRTNVRRSETWSGIYDQKSGQRVKRMQEVTVEADWMVHTNEHRDLNEAPLVAVSINHSDCEFYTPAQAIELARHLVETAGEILGRRIAVIDGGPR